MSPRIRSDARLAQRRERVRALRAEVERRRQHAREQLDLRRGASAGTRKSKRRWVALGLLMLLLFFVPECEEEAPPLAPEPRSADTVERTAGTPAPPRPGLPGGQVPLTSRSSMPVPQPDALPWLASFEMQVAARSPRLAGCFEGARRPGALQWTARVESVTGTVSDHALEPLLETESLSARRRACLVEVLSTPPYRLHQHDRRATPPRVRLVIEF